MTLYKNIYELHPRYDARQSFYGKAQILEGCDGITYLKSYDTIVARCKNGIVTLDGLYSQTTSRHQKEFMRQYDTTGRSWNELKREA